MKIKLKILFIIFSCTAFLANGQKKMHFEQIAFDYYKDSILKNNQKQYKISKEIIDFESSYWNIECLKEFNLIIDDTAGSLIPPIDNGFIKFKGDKRFKKKKFKKKNLPMVFVTRYITYNENKNITAVVENLDGVFITYLFEINQEGEIKKWCSGEFIKK